MVVGLLGQRLGRQFGVAGGCRVLERVEHRGGLVLAARTRRWMNNKEELRCCALVSVPCLIKACPGYRDGRELPIERGLMHHRGALVVMRAKTDDSWT